ncbi:hypothetical protein NSZ01_16330 [Nocardioides szechwanensis]|uniref:Uncharacterized protein n=1 Tax=Nocardioides szechwanensis TaxID=1005944 RepID=A0A1G9Z9G1_9ACTN|nr:hypothetical protein NSZ01_16330 [Nocardioides szechwanensis]SDN18052.1 hypothetical protein SAMN05192576_1659 [Nocardioides szechwanensis]
MIIEGASLSEVDHDCESPRGSIYLDAVDLEGRTLLRVTKIEVPP